MTPRVENVNGETRFEYTCRAYGVGVRVVSGNKRVVDLAVESFGAWDVLSDDDTTFDAEANCVVETYREIRTESLAPAYTIDGGKLRGLNSCCDMCADRSTGRARIRVSEEYAQASPTLFQRHFLDCAIQFLATRKDRVPVHASAAIIDGRPVLIVGSSNSGKSTLLYALARSGFPVLAEESVCVSYQSSFALWGLAREIGLRPEALHFFSELNDAHASVQPNGKVKYLAQVSPEQRPYPRQVGPVTLVFLGEGEGAPIVPLTSEEATQRLLADRESGFDIAPDYADAVAALVTNSNALLLRRCEPPIGLAEILVRHLRRSAP